MNITELKNRKKELGLSNERVSELSGVPLSTVQKAFAGTTSVPREDTLRRIERAIIRAEIDRRTEAYSLEPKRTDRVAEESILDLYDDYFATVYDWRDPPSDISIPKKNQGDYTLLDWYAMPPDRRVELIDGVIYDLGYPSTLHQLIISELHMEIYRFISDNGKPCVVMESPVGVRLEKDDRTVVQPDLLVICHKEEENGGKDTSLDEITDEEIENTPAVDFRKRFINGAPDFIAEVLSPSNPDHDTKLKLDLYMRAGVREYWMVDPERECVIVKHRDEDAALIYSFRNSIPVHISGGDLSIDFSALKKRVARQDRFLPPDPDRGE